MNAAAEGSGGSRRGRRGNGSRGGDNGAGGRDEGIGEALGMPGTTGRFLVLMREGPSALAAASRALSDRAGFRIASAADFDAGELPADTLGGADAMVLPRLGVAVVSTPPDEVGRVSAMAAGEDAILAIEPERVVYALAVGVVDGIPAVGLAPPPPISAGAPAGGAGLSLDYLLGYRQAIDHLVAHMLGERGAAAGPAGPGAIVAPAAVDESRLTWGLQATMVAESPFSGKGVKVAVLDTGLDLGHPDFAGRQISPRSFIAGEDVQDGHGHGTHCIGTACGPRQPGRLPRYGIAYESEIFAGKVLSNRGSGSDGGILAGIDWAIASGCAIVSMSLGAAAMPGQSFSRVYEAVARRALGRGTLIIAAAGNESFRPSLIAPVGHPANCPSILAVAALDQQSMVAPFSCGGLNPQGGQVDIAGPGVAVRSSWPRPVLHRSISGTSMATPHVAGIAALHAQANPDMRGGSLGWLLMQSSRRLTLPTRDIGVGLVQAPIS